MDIRLILKQIIREELEGSEITSKPAIKDNVERIAQLVGTVLHRTLTGSPVPGQKIQKNPKLDSFVDSIVLELEQDLLKIIETKYSQSLNNWKNSQ